MRTLHLYLTRQVLVALAMTVAVIAFVFVLGNMMKEILALLVSRQATLGMILQALLFLVPWVMVFALPFGMLAATLLVFGRFSADHELTAVRASGISLLSLVSPVLLLAVAMSCLCAVFNLQLGPQCRIAYKTLLSQVRLDLLDISLPAGTFIREFPGYTIYIGKRTREYLEDVRIYEMNEGKVQRRLDAPRGKFIVDAASNQISLVLYEGTTLDMSSPEVDRWITMNFQEWPLPPLDLKKMSQGSRDAPLNDMTLVQLMQRMADLQDMVPEPQAMNTLSREQFAEASRILQKLRDEITMPVRVYIHSKVSFSFACIGFALIGIPLGIQAHRRETSVGMGIALILAVMYFGFLALGQSLQARPELHPHLIVWIPNLLFQVVGGVLLWRASQRR